MIGYAAYQEWITSRPVSLRVDIPDLTISDAIAGTGNMVSFAVKNRGKDSIQIIGAESNCVESCCFYARLDGAPIIQPGEQAYVKYEVFPRSAGERFEGESDIFVLWRGRLEKVHVTVSGVARADTAAK